MTQRAAKPVCLSLIVCDDIYRDEETKKLILVGTFNVVNVGSLPAPHPKFSVLFTLTDAKGEYGLTLRIEHEQSGQLVFQIHGPLQIEDPLAICDFNLTLSGVTFRDPGKHWIILEADGQVLMQRPILVQLKMSSQTEEPRAL